MRYDLHLSIRYQFARPIGAARQLLRICPAILPDRQSVPRCDITITPQPVERHRFTDFFCTEVTQVVMPAGSSAFQFEMKAEVHCHPDESRLDLSTPLPELPADLASVGDLDPQSPHHFLRPSPRIPDDPDITRFAIDACSRAPSTRAAIEGLGRAIRAHMRFDARATRVDTPIASAFAGRRGVCQDYSQIMIAGLRSLGIPAAYVSGFLRTEPPQGQPRLQGADAMHAWVRAWTGLEGGWIEYDPTNGCFVSTDHVVIAYGRDYSDAAPLTGAMRLTGSQSGHHTVDLIALD